MIYNVQHFGIGFAVHTVLVLSIQAQVTLPDSKLVGLAQQYAPKVFLHPEDAFRPSSIDFFLEYVRVTKQGAALPIQPPILDSTNLDFQGNEASERQSFLTTYQPLACPTCTNLAFLKGQGPSAPVFALIVPKPNVSAIDIFYWMFYPYNLGRRVCLTQGYNPVTDTCPGPYNMYGNHVGDWEHVTVRLASDTLLPMSILLAQHAGGKAYPWGSPEIQIDPTDGGQHPVVYSANGSHATYAAPGVNVYLGLGNGFNLTDPTARGPAWNTWQALKVIQYLPPGQYSGDTSWLNWGGLWGNQKDGCNETDLVTKLTGDCPLNSGPPGPTFQGWTTSDVLA